MKLLIISFILLSIFFSFISDSGNVNLSEKYSNGKIIYVGGQGPGNYTRIQDAVDAAENGWTIFVYDDSSPYHENIVINKRISLIGENKYTTIVDGMGKKAIVLNSNESEIKNFTFRNCSGLRINGNLNNVCDNIISSGERHGGDGIYINDATHGNRVCNNTIYGYSRGDSAGILLRYDSYDCYILNNSIYDCGYAILVNGIGYSIIGNEIKNSSFGVYIASFGMKQCFVEDNNISNVGYGICVESFTPICYIENNTIMDVNTAIRVLDSAKNATIRNNNLLSGYYGIRLSSNNIVTRNEIDDFIYGIEAIGINNSITENNFVNNTRNAVFMSTPNKWYGNYWYNWRIPVPKPIFGMVGKLDLIPWMQFDYHPAKKPWKIGGDK